MRQVTVTLANETYEIQELPTRLNEVWREDLEERLAPLVEAVKELAAAGDLDPAKALESSDEIERVIRIVLSSPVEIRDMVLAYSPELEGKRDHLLDNGFDSEFVEAFMQILGLAYPFGGLLTSLSNLSEAGRSRQENGGQKQPKK